MLLCSSFSAGGGGVTGSPITGGAPVPHLPRPLPGPFPPGCYKELSELSSIISWLTNSALVYEPKCKGRGESQPMSSAVHRSPNKVWRSNSILSLWFPPKRIVVAWRPGLTSGGWFRWTTMNYGSSVTNTQLYSHPNIPLPSGFISRTCELCTESHLKPLISVSSEGKILFGPQPSWLGVHVLYTL